jgi:protein O-GlcNAc transferase
MNRSANPVPAAQAMQRAEALFGGGQWSAAEQMCRLVLNAEKDHFDALEMLGILAAQTGRTAEALHFLERAAAARPDKAEAHFNHANLLNQLGRLEEARAGYERALAVSPDFAEAYYNRGNVLRQLGRLEEALGAYESAAAARTDFADSHNSSAAALRDLGRLQEALQSCRRALEIRPDYPEAHHTHGVILQDLGRLEEAIASHEHALRLKPNFAEAYKNRGDVLRLLRCFEEALEDYQRAARLKPDFAEAYEGACMTLRELRRFAEALQNCDRVLKIRPDLPEAHNNRGVILQDSKRYAEALDSYSKALEVKPDFADAHKNRAATLQELKRQEEALDSFERALALNPDLPWLFGTALFARLELAQWTGMESQLEALAARIMLGHSAAQPFAAAVLFDSLQLQHRAAQCWAAESSAPRSTLPPFPRPSRRKRIRVGYYSADYHGHATAYLAAGLFEAHDRDRFEIVAFSFGPEAGDGMRKRLTSSFDRFLDVRAKSDREIAQLSRELQIDIAVDLKGFTQDERKGIFLHRAAPVQINYLGYPGTMAASYMDYIVADPVLIPAASRQYYTEKIVYLPNSYQVNDRKREISARQYSRAELGLPPEGFVFCCFNNCFKILPAVFDSWMRILKQVEGSVLWLLADSESAVTNLRRNAEARGVQGTRLIFARREPVPEHLARHRAADLFLDTLPYNAHTTASDALWAGLPVLTRTGESFAARVAASLLSAIHLPELVTSTPEQYEALAVELATDPARLAQIRGKLAENRLGTPLFDTTSFTRHLEDAYGQIHERYQQGLPPDNIFVG